MRTKVPCLIITFFTTADAIAFEKYAKENELSGRLIPIPRELSAGCGMAFRLEKASLPDDYHTILLNSDIPFQEQVDMLH